MGQFLLWTIAVLITAGHADAEYTFPLLTGLAQDTSNFVNNILTQVNYGIKSTLKPIKQFISTTTARTGSFLDSVRKVAKTLQNYTNDEIGRLVQDLRTAVQNGAKDIQSKIDAGSNVIIDIIGNIFDSLSQLKPDVIRIAIDKVADDVAPGLANFVEEFNLTCSNEDGDLLDEIVDGLNEYKENKREFKDLVTKVIEHCILAKYNELTDEAKDKFQAGLNRALTNINVYLNDMGRKTYFRLAFAKRAASDLIRKLVKRIAYRISNNIVNDEDTVDTI